MTDDDLLKHLDFLCKETKSSEWHDDKSNVFGKAAVRIRELEARLKTSTKQRDYWKSVFSRHFTSVKNGTHVIVPVEPTPEMIEAAVPPTLYVTEILRKYFQQAYQDMIRAAQPERQQGE